MDEKDTMNNTTQNETNTTKTVGALLREARTAKGLALTEVERKLNISETHLRAVENDDYSTGLEEVFLKGIIRSYGNFLGLNGLELVNQYKMTTKGATREQLAKNAIREVKTASLNIQLKSTRDVGSGTGNFFKDTNLPLKQIALILAGLAVLVLLFLGGKWLFTRVSATTLPSFPSIGTSSSKETDSKASESPAEAEKKSAKVFDKVEAEMTASGTCWTEVYADGKEAFAGMLYENDKKTFEAKEKLSIKFGNIGVMKLVVNGEPINLEGEHGVAVKTFLRQEQQSK